MLCLARQANGLPDQPLRHWDPAFLNQGGFTRRPRLPRQPAREGICG